MQCSNTEEVYIMWTVYAELSLANTNGVLLQDYAPTPYLIKHVNLNFLLNEDATRVKSLLSVLPNYGSAGSPPSLVLDGAHVPVPP